MAQHLHREITNLKKKILSLSALVEESVKTAVRSIAQNDVAMATYVIDHDFEIDQMEVEVEEECLKILALHQPVAIDMRFIIAVLKINNDLERIGDLAVNVAEQGEYLAAHEKVPIAFDFPGMVEKVQAMLRKSLDALVNMDAELAHSVCASDDEVDAINRQMYGLVENGIRKNPDNVEYLIHMLSVSRHLERIADLATNISEDVIYMIEGVIVRHRVEDFIAIGRKKSGENVVPPKA
ncbi:MAG TPA: phosphate signaling complex protein PhoU [Planctomycetota bacterium]|nr:phosphate signaling complex protein PhoU [Planctomycetota bacterium]